MKDLAKKEFLALLAAALVGFNSPNIFILSQGFESAMLVLVLLVSLYLLRRDHYIPTLVLAGLAPLVRPEGLLLTPLVWAYILITGVFKRSFSLPISPSPSPRFYSRPSTTVPPFLSR
jgi:Gpi18-like mannosyltransferase